MLARTPHLRLNPFCVQTSPLYNPAFYKYELKRSGDIKKKYIPQYPGNLKPAINPENQKLCDFLAEKYKETDPEHPYKRSYGLLARIIARVAETIESSTQIMRYQGVGPKTMAIVQELLKDADLPRHDVDKELFQELSRVPNLHSRTIEALIKAGCKSLKDLEEPQFMSILTTFHQASFKYRETCDKPTTPEMCQDLLEFCREAVPSYEWILSGSHRRGQITADISLILLHPDYTHTPKPYTSYSSIPKGPLLTSTARATPSGGTFIPRAFRNSSPLQDVLAVLENKGLTGEDIHRTMSSWYGIVRLPGKKGKDWFGGDQSRKESGGRSKAMRDVQGEFRRIRIYLVSKESYPAALLETTGDVEFIRCIHHAAWKKQMLLNEHGLWKWNGLSLEEQAKMKAEGTHESRRARIDRIESSWEFIPTASEDEIVEKVGMTPVPPNKRDWPWIRVGVKGEN